MWWVIGIAAALLVLLAIWAMVARNKRLDAARTEAAGIREKAAGQESYVASAEQRAGQLQAEARQAQKRAEELHERAEEATRVAREHRDRVTGGYLEADEIDPDVRRRD